jgi:hypothetical protein
MYAQKQSGRVSAGEQSSNVLLRALAEGDPTLGRHSEGVPELAETVAVELGLPEFDIARVRLAAELHDIGKLAIPDAILEKPATLTADEWEFVRSHTEIGELDPARRAGPRPRRGRDPLDARELHGRLPTALAGDGSARWPGSCSSATRSTR